MDPRRNLGESLPKLLKFVDDFIFENQMYFRIHTIYRSQQFELQWQSRGPINWRLRLIGSQDWLNVKTEDLIDRMNAFGLDLIEFEISLRADILQCAAYANSFLQESQRLLGDAAVAEAIIANEEFLQELQVSISKVINGSSSTNGAANKTKNQGHGFLRLLSDGVEYSQ